MAQTDPPLPHRRRRRGRRTRWRGARAVTSASGVGLSELDNGPVVNAPANHQEPGPVQRWTDFCERIKATGNAILDKRPDLSQRDQTDGLRFLARVLADGILSQMGPPNLDEPFIHRFIDA